MLGKLTGLSTALAAVAMIVLVAPSAALACGGGSSAVDIYHECLPSASGGGNTQGSSQKVSKDVSNAISRAGTKNKVQLDTLIKNPSFGQPTRGLQSVPQGAIVAPSSIGAAFDLGPGPIALIALLGGTAVLLLGATGWRGWRRWRNGLPG